MINPADLMNTAVQATGIALDLIRSVPRGRSTAKGDRDMATETDYAIERAVRAFLAERTPDIGFLGEEDGLSGSAGEWMWVLDPIDGTVNFVHGLPLCAVSLALLHGDRPVLGVIELPLLGARFTAVEGHGAYENDMPVTVSQVSDLGSAVVATGDYSVSPDAADDNRVRLAVTAELAARAQRVRMLGSAAIDLVWLASGRLDASVTMGNNAWDMAAGVVIAREAGALVLDADGTEHTTRYTATIAVSPGIRDDILAIVSRASG
ncbi:inositol monophosphatase [Catellatospora methionotrophica]|uniref:Inositol-1-monophosphatase n=1 Tax=Catellatospora methionotrophica TaxID=121620 RepID=A0A8J3LGZ3_9ACTN|nr:inositol monophosphatase family protein [Catellatospora methionotrophica]GIG18163.1 inositol monophosphatase [Catellatospora methionotrophica]